MEARLKEQFFAGWTLPVFFACLLIYSLRYASAYLVLQEQMVFGWGCFFVLTILRIAPFAKRQPWRLAFILIAAILAARYLMWRTTDTLLYTGPLDFIGMSAVYLAEVYAITISFLGMFINAWPVDRKPTPLTGDEASFPTVDVLIPTYNEPDEIIHITTLAATQIDYPKDRLKVWILDDGGTDQKRSDPANGTEAWERHYRLRRLADELGAGYITRSRNLQAKAGNINHALSQTQGELLLFLDCDHVPTADILRNTVGFFQADPKLFLVQTPHFFLNAGPIDRHMTNVSEVSQESDMFYRSIQPALDLWNAAYFCGSAAVMRRSCLEQIGGICGTTITEDAETAFQLHGLGYNSIYLNLPMICGLSPESFDGYVIQHSRWAQGMVQLFLLNNPMKAAGLSLPQRLAYFNSCFFWFFSLARLVYFLAPASFLVLGLHVYNASWLQIIAYALPYVLSTYLLMSYLYSESRETVISEIYESVQSVFLIPALVSVLLHPHKPSFIVTRKGSTIDSNYLSPLSAPLLIVVIINAMALVLSLVKWFSEPLLREVILVTAGWSVINLYLGLCALGAFWEAKQVRHSHRIRTMGEISLYFPRMHSRLQGQIRDISVTGIGLAIPNEFPISDRERVTAEVRTSKGDVLSFEANIVRTFKHGNTWICGVEFVAGVTPFNQAVRFVFSDSQRWVNVWRAKSTASRPVRTTIYFLFLGVKAMKGASFLAVKQLLSYIAVAIGFARDRLRRNAA